MRCDGDRVGVDGVAGMIFCGAGVPCPGDWMRGVNHDPLFPRILIVILAGRLYRVQPRYQSGVMVVLARPEKAGAVCRRALPVP